MKKMTRFLAIVLAAVLVLSCFCTAFAKKNDGWKEIGIGPITITIPKINLKIGNISEKIDPYNPLNSPIVGFTNAFNDAFGNAFTDLGASIGEMLAGLLGSLTNLGGLFGGLDGRE